MASLTLTIPDAIAPRVRNAYCYQNGYSDTVIGPAGTPIPNPENKTQYMKRHLALHIKETVKAWEATVAAEAARKAAADAAERDVEIT